MTESDENRPASVHAQMIAGAHLREGWDALATLFSGVLVFGLPAWWLSSALDWVWVLPVGLVLGMGAGIAAVWVRYGVHRP
jgi:sirohydrochlorin ferrochelatase